MNRQYRITLDGTILNDEPLGLIDTELNIVRDEKLKGIFFSYTTDLTFYGDGYNILRSYRDNGCASVPCLIEYDCDMSGAYQLLFQGVIPIGSPDIEWNESNCTVTTKIENADFSNFLETYGDYEFRINTPFCLDGVTPLAQITAVFPTPWTDLAGTAATVAAKSYLYIDVLRQCLSYLSNNSISLDEDPLYSTLFQPQRYEISYLTPYASLNSIEIEFTNFFGQTWNVQATPAFQAELSFLQFLTHFVGNAIPTATEARAILTNYGDKANFIDVSSTPRVITNFVPWQSVSIVTDPPNQATITETQAFQYGLKNLAMTSDSIMLNQDNSLSTTLNRLMQHAVGVDNMGYYLQVTGPNTYNLVLRYYPALIQNTNTNIHLQGVAGIMSKSSSEFNAQIITTPQGGTHNIDKTFSWATNACFGSNVKINAEGISTEEILGVYSGGKASNELRLMFLRDGDYSQVQNYELFITYNTATPPTVNYAKTNQVMYNAPYFMPLTVWRNIMYAGGFNLRGQISQDVGQDGTCANCPDAVIINDSGVLFKNIYSFEHQLSFSEVQTIINQSLQFITFSDTRGLNKTGFIKEITIPFKDFIANFELYTA